MSQGILTVLKPPSSTPEDADAALIAGGKLALALALQEAARRGLRADGTREAALVGPKTDEELLDGVEALTGHRIPRVAVCTDLGHTSPAQTFCDIYFERIHNVLWIGNRGGGKTANSGFLHGAKGRFNPNYSSALAGAAEKQGYRGYAEYKRYIRLIGSEVLSSIMSKTELANGSLTEVLGGTIRQLNGPHPHFAQMDELELITSPAVFEEFLNMAQADARYSAQQLLTSTRKRAFGIVQQLVAQCQTAIRAGETPPWEVRIFCIFETMEQVESCRTAPENADKPESELCQCHKVKKGEWDDGKPRTFDTVCKGRAYRSDGHIRFEDVLKRFRTLSRMTWEAQQECLQPEQEGLVHNWMRPRHTLPAWYPLPQFGPIFRGWDWGGRNPNAVVWIQRLAVAVSMVWQDIELPDGRATTRAVPVTTEGDPRQPFITLPEGAWIQFDEVYKRAHELPGDGGYSDLGEFVAERELEWRAMGFPMDIAGDYCDPSGLVGKREVKKAYRLKIEGDPKTYATLEIPKWKSIPAPVSESVRLHISEGEADMIYVVGPMCSNTLDEYDVYHWPDKQTNRNQSENPIPEDDHAMDATRYVIWNRYILDNRGQHERPGAQERDASEEVPQGKLDPPHTAPIASSAAGSYLTQPTSGPDTTRVRSGTVPGGFRSMRAPLPGRR